MPPGSRKRFRSSCCFFQAEDGIRAADVTGVHTCALPILAAGRAAFSPDAGGLLCANCSRGLHTVALSAGPRAALWQLRWGGLAAADAPVSADGSGRSEERRVGGEGTRWGARTEDTAGMLR